jgi:hypothetical protein
LGFGGGCSQYLDVGSLLFIHGAMPGCSFYFRAFATMTFPQQELQVYAMTKA